MKNSNFSYLLMTKVLVHFVFQDDGKTEIRVNTDINNADKKYTGIMLMVCAFGQGIHFTA